MLRQSYTAQPGLNHDMLRLRPCDKKVPLIRSVMSLWEACIYIKETTIPSNTLRRKDQESMHFASIVDPFSITPKRIMHEEAIGKLKDETRMEMSSRYLKITYCCPLIDL